MKLVENFNLHHHGWLLSSSGCDENVHYSYDESTFTVNGCNAKFEVCVQPRVTTAAPATTQPPPPGQFYMII